MINNHTHIKTQNEMIMILNIKIFKIIETLNLQKRLFF